MNADNVNQILDALAARFGSTGAHLWLVLQRQAYVEFYVALAWCALAIGICAAIWRKSVASWKDPLDEESSVVFAVGGVLCMVGLVVATIGLFVALPGVLNPEYFALREILRALP